MARFDPGVDDKPQFPTTIVFNFIYLCFRINQMELTKDIETYPEFCTKCGSILPPLSMEEFVKCYSCKTVFGPES